MIKLWDKAPLAVEGWEEPHIIISGQKKEGQKRAAVIVCPGGAYHGKADYEGVPVAEWLDSIGIQGITLFYRTVPYSYPCAFMDVSRAIRYVRYHAEELGVDADKIGILGFSAGGHLAAYAGTHFDNGDMTSDDPIERVSSKPNAMILCYPVISFLEHGHIGSIENLMGRKPTQEECERESAQLCVKTDTPSAFIWHTSDDDCVDVRNSLEMGAALREKNIPFEMHVFPHGPHGMTMGNGDAHVAQWLELCKNWLENIGFYNK